MTTRAQGLRLEPLTVKAARRLVTARRWGRVQRGLQVATQVAERVVDGDEESWLPRAVAAGGPSRLDPTSFEIHVFAADPGSAFAARAATAVGKCALAMGFERAAVRLPHGAVAKQLKEARWRVVHSDDAGEWWGVEAEVPRGYLRVVPLTQSQANGWVDDTHSHLDPSKGSMFSVGVLDSDGELHCVAQAGVVRARMLMESGAVAEVVRVASDKTQNAASMALGAVTRALAALGYPRVVSYTLLGESGHSYRVAGWRPTSLSAGGDWGRASRSRAKAKQGHRKVRWEWGPGAALLAPDREAELLARVAESVGQVEFETRGKRRAKSGVG